MQSDWSDGDGQLNWIDNKKFYIEENLTVGKSIILNPLKNTSQLKDLGAPKKVEAANFGKEGNWACVTSIVEGKDKRIYGFSFTPEKGISGKNSHFFSYNPVDNKLQDKGVPFPEDVIIHSLINTTEGKIIGGTGSAAGGEIFIYDPESDEFKNLGSPLREEKDIQALVLGKDGNIYGGTSPNGHLFMYNERSNKIRDIGQAIKDEGNIKTMICASNGLIYGGTIESPNFPESGGHLFIFDPQTKTVRDMGRAITGENRIYDLSENVDGKIYGITYPGAHLFCYSPAENRVEDLMQIKDGQRAVIISIASGKDGKIYLGLPSKKWEIEYSKGTSTSGAQFFSYDPQSKKLEKIGADIDKELLISSLLTSEEGKIYGATLGEGHLFAYTKKFKAKGFLVSSSYDTGKKSSFKTISWSPVEQPSLCGEGPLKFQIATNNDNTTWKFVGPDGTEKIFYTNASGEMINSIHQGDRFIRYKTFFSTKNNDFTPLLEKVSITYAEIK